MAASVTAALLVIGDEILSGRTKDKNIGYIAEYLTDIGIDLREVRVVPDVEAEIVAAVNALRARYTYLFTTGGIGPTHDDITADCVAQAFGVSIDIDERARAMMLRALPARGPERGAPAHGADPGGRRPHREPDLQGAGLPDRQRDRHGRRAGDHAGHARQRRARPCATGARMVVETVEAESLPEGLYAAGLARGREGACRRVHRLLSLLHGRRIPQPDRGARQGRRRRRRRRVAAVRDLLAGLQADRAPV